MEVLVIKNEIKLMYLKILKWLGISSSFLGYIAVSDKLPPPLEEKDEIELLKRLKNKDKDAKNILVEKNLRLVVYIAKKFENSGINIEDLISIGTIGLMKALNSYDMEKNIKLATYASRCIENEILMYLRSTKKLGAEVYLEDTIGKDKDDNSVTLKEVLENNEKNIEDEVDLKLKVKKLYDKIKEVLKDREKTIIELRFGLNGDKPKTQKQIAKMMGISRSYVSRIETKAIGKLAQEFKE